MISSSFRYVIVALKKKKKKRKKRKERNIKKDKLSHRLGVQAMGGEGGSVCGGRGGGEVW